MNLSDLGNSGKLIALELALLAACLAVPAWQNAALDRRASEVVRAVRVVRAAASTQHAARGAWAEDGAPGQAPASLVAYLPGGFAFDRGSYTLDWIDLPVNGGDEAEAAGAFVGVSVLSQDARLLDRVDRLLGSGQAHFSVGDRLTVVLASGPSAPAP